MYMLIYLFFCTFSFGNHMILMSVLLSPYDFSVSRSFSKQMTSWLLLLAFFFLQFENFVASLVAHVSHIQEQYGAEVTENYETTCWGCGLRVLLPSCASIFKCGWCGAITDQNKKKRDQKCFRWRILRDRCFVSVVIIFMFFVICKSVVSAISIFFLLSSFLTRLAFVFLWGQVSFSISPPFPSFPSS